MDAQNNSADSALSRESLKCFYANAQGLLSKLPELRLRHAAQRFDVIAVTETWLSSSVADAEISLPGMIVIRKDRPTKGGGVLLYHNSSLHCEPLSHIHLQTIDSLWCRLQLRNSDSALLAVIYRPPNAQPVADVNLLHSLRFALSMQHSHVLLMGDFNSPSLTVEPSRDTFAWELRELIGSHPLYNHVTEPTRFRGIDTPSLLDLLLTNEELMIEEILSETPLGKSDHIVLTFDFVCYANYLNHEDSQLRTVTDYGIFYDAVADNSFDFMLKDGPNSAWQNFVTKWHQMLELSSVSKPVLRKTTDTFIRSRTRKWMCRRNAAWTEFKLTQLPNDWECYRKLRNHCTGLVRQDKFDYQSKLTGQFLENNKLLYKFINNKRKVQTGIPSLTNKHGNTTTTKEAANALKEHYMPIFQGSSVSPHISLPPFSSSFLISSVDFTPSAVRNKILQLRTNSSPGIDGITPKALQAVADQLSEPLAHYFQRLLDASEVPDGWKDGIITPLFKSGNRSDPANYRPVTLLPVLSKVMESIIADHIMTVMERSNVLTAGQHGFRRSRSCTSNLLFAKDLWTKAADEGYGVDVIYLDFSKAFDRVDHAILLEKLRAIGIGPPLLTWMAAFLGPRSLRVRVRNELSEPFPVYCSVPQGSVLGPRLFLLFINDITKYVTSPLLLFADDIKLWRVIRSPTDNRDLQSDLTSLQCWAACNNLPFNTDKCRVLLVRRRGDPVYSLGGTRLQICKQEKDLGVLTQDDLGCSAQCAQASTVANRNVGLLRRAFGSFDPRLFKHLLNAYVRPHLEYAASVWNPWLKRDQHIMEQPQRRATKLVKGLRYMSYEARLQVLNLFSTKYRRIRGDMILTYRILTEDGHPCSGMLSLAPPSGNRGHHLKLSHQYSRLECRSNFFALRVPRTWNSLHPSVISAPSLSIFKERLDLHFFNILRNF